MSKNQQTKPSAPAAATPTILEAPKPLDVTITAYAIRRQGPMWVIQNIEIVNGVVVNASDNQPDTLGMQLARLEKIITKEFR